MNLRSIFDIHKSSFYFLVLSEDIWFDTASIFGMYGLNFVHISSNLNRKQILLFYLSSRLILTEMQNSLFFTFCTFSRCPDSISWKISFSTWLCRWYSMGLFFYFAGGGPGFSCLLISVFLLVLFVFKNSFKSCHCSVSFWSVGSLGHTINVFYRPKKFLRANPYRVAAKSLLVR